MCDGLSNQRVLSLIVHLKGLAVVQAVVSSCLHVCVFSMSFRDVCVFWVSVVVSTTTNQNQSWISECFVLRSVGTVN